ncbi:DUF4350 domain-containing protein [Nocardioides aestuarii]|uniref:DUF4350 domain-containing protein n=1 Tax=Nocardioides aestuarii TaxID=252231 RepID=A0ABW4TKW1_9ACTN
MRGAWERHRTALLLTLAVLAALGVAALTAGRPTTSATYDPDNPGPGGARAAAQVLRDRGVEVDVVRDAASLEAAAVTADTTVVVTSSSLLGSSTADRLLAHVGEARLVVVEPGPGTTEALGVTSLPETIRVPGPVAAGCDDPVVGDLEVEVDGALAFPGPGCFGVEEGQLLAQPRPGLTLLGFGEAMRNDQVLRADNAAAVLRLLGQEPRLVWYVPDLTDLVADDGVSLATLLPTWLRPAFLLVVVASLALVAWRARRLGALAVEPLPVVVRALETTRSRGRLYRRAGARDHAADALRRATRRRLGSALAVAHPDDSVLLDRLAARLGRPRDELAALLDPAAAPPAHDRDLIALASALAALEEEVRRP